LYLRSSSLMIASLLLSLIYFFILRYPSRSTLFPYTTLFRSQTQSHSGSVSPRSASASPPCPPPPSQSPGKKSPNPGPPTPPRFPDRKSTRLNSSHVAISYAVFCLKKKKNKTCRSNIILLIQG